MKKEIERKSVGRSMIEMLGVLAIIGMLSVGTLGGIRHILDKNTANEVLKEALTQASEIKLRRRQKVFTSGDKKGEVKYAYQSTYIKSRTYSSDGLSLILKTKNDISENVCKHLLSEGPVSIFDSISTQDGKCKTYNTMIFTTDTTSLPSRGEFDACANENCCGHGTCNPDTGYCECNSGWGGDKCCSQTCQGIIMERGCAIEDAYSEGCQIRKKEICLSDQYCSVDADTPNGICVTCSAGEILNPTKDGCIPACETGLVWDEDAGKCDCPTAVADAFNCLTQTQTNALGCVSYVSACDLATQKCVEGICEGNCTTGTDCPAGLYCNADTGTCQSCPTNMVVNEEQNGCDCVSGMFWDESFAECQCNEPTEDEANCLTVLEQDENTECFSYVSACDATQKCVNGVCETTCTTSAECGETGYCDTTNQICISCAEDMVVNAAGTGCECGPSYQTCSLNGSNWCCGAYDDCSTTTVGECKEYAGLCVVKVEELENSSNCSYNFTADVQNSISSTVESGCSYGEYCFINWTDADASSAVSTSTAIVGLRYGKCIGWLSNSAPPAKLSMTVEKECPYGQSCDVLWTSKTCGGTMTSSTPILGQYYGLCSGWASFSSSANCPTS